MSKKKCKTRQARPADRQLLPEVATQDPDPPESRDPMFYAATGAECVYYRARLTHCPHCMRIRLPDKSQAVICRAIYAGVAYLRCRACGKNGKAPAR